MTTSPSDGSAILKEYERLQKEYQEIYSFVSKAYNEEPPVLMDRLTSLTVYMARIGRLYADAEALDSFAMARKFGSMPQGMSPSIQKEYLKAHTRKTHKLVTLFEKLGSTISNQIKAVITQLSYLKTEMQNIH